MDVPGGVPSQICCPAVGTFARARHRIRNTTPNGTGRINHASLFSTATGYALRTYTWLDLRIQGQTDAPETRSCKAVLSGNAPCSDDMGHGSYEGASLGTGSPTHDACNMARVVRSAEPWHASLHNWPRVGSCITCTESSIFDVYISSLDGSLQSRTLLPALSASFGSCSCVFPL